MEINEVIQKEKQINKLKMTFDKVSAHNGPMGNICVELNQICAHITFSLLRSNPMTAIKLYYTLLK